LSSIEQFVAQCISLQKTHGNIVFLGAVAETHPFGGCPSFFFVLDFELGVVLEKTPTLS
jgi:hypothetical protein